MKNGGDVMFKFITKHLRGRKGFTLIELVVVIAILGILALIAVPKLSNMQNSARIEADKITAATIVNAAKIYIIDKNLTSDTEIKAVKIQDLADAKLIESATIIAQTNKTNMVLEVSGTAAEPIFTVKADGHQIYPEPTEGAFFKP